MSKIAFVIPRCGVEIAGGAEALCLSLANRLVEKGYDIEILATCAKDNRSWENFYESGESKVLNVTVKRFLVDERDLDKWIPLQLKLQDGFRLSVDEQLTWMEESVNSKSLYKYINDNQDSYKAFIFAPYLFGTTFFGSQIVPEKSFLLPCLHKEMYAETDVFKAMFKNVNGCFFNALPEQELAISYFGKLKGGVVGMGFDLNYQEGAKKYFKDDFPYVVYLGRKETGKNVHTLIDYFIFAKDNNLVNKDLKLVVVGPGDFSDTLRESALLRDDVVDLGKVSEDDKTRIISHALTLCQPSLNESFSIVLMEAWMQKISVIVHGDCAVTKHHVIESNGGLYFQNEEEFAFVLAELLANEKLCKALGENGFDYVKKVYDWDVIIDNFVSVSKELSII